MKAGGAFNIDEEVVRPVAFVFACFRRLLWLFRKLSSPVTKYLGNIHTKAGHFYALFIQLRLF
jgi:hypothetical protein